MKLQHLSILFIILIIPIVIVLSVYLSTQISTVRMQTQYTTYLTNATHDAISAFELNTKNNNYASLQASEARDINASIETFYKSLSNSIGRYTPLSIREFTPAILNTTYDGYYIYTKYYDSEVGRYTYGLKPKFSYSMRYKKGNNDFVVFYTLDNRITIIGNIDGEYVARKGDLINLNSNISISREHLSEKIIYIDDLGMEHTDEYDYYILNHQKIYKEKGQERFFTYSTNYTKDYISDSDSRIEKLRSLLNGETLESDSAIKYYTEAIEFTNWVNNKLGDITQADAIDVNGNQIQFSTNLDNASIFLTGSDNDPLNEASAFNEQRMNVIRYSIEKNLITAIANYNSNSQVGYEFLMPKLSETDWYKIENYVSMVSFLEGVPIKTKMYNNYVVISNNSNRQMINLDAIYAIDDNGNYHAYGCEETGNIINYYYITDFNAKTVDLSGEQQSAIKQLSDVTSEDILYFYPQSYQACYKCLVDYLGNIDKSTNQNKLSDSNYLRALGRLKYDLLGDPNL